MTDHAIDWIRQQKALMPDKPFFVYFAPGRHPRPAPRARRSGPTSTRAASTQGWDRLREETFARQKELGVIPADAELTARPAEIPAWDDMPDDLKPVLARQMEVYAGFLEHTDHHVGRLVDALADLEILDDTLVYYIIGDNGASAEGTPNGCFNELIVLNGAAGLETAEFMASRIDDFGTPAAYNHYAVGWAHAMDTPVPVDQAGRVALGRHPQRHDRALARRLRGQGRDPLAVPPRHRRRHRPSSTPPACRQPLSVNGVQQMPLHGVSMAPTLRRRRRAETSARRSTSRCSATAASTTRAGRR